MADYIVKDTELTSVANAIRTAGGTSSLLNFPNGFVSAVNNISGGGSSDFSTAQVTVVNNNTSIEELWWDSCPTLDLENGLINGGFYSDTTSVTVLVPLYKGKCYWDISIHSLTFTGNIEEFWEGLLITGDCTITIS